MTTLLYYPTFKEPTTYCSESCCYTPEYSLFSDVVLISQTYSGGEMDGNSFKLKWN